MISVDLKLTKGVCSVFHDTLNRGIEAGDSPGVSVQRAIRSIWRLAIQAGADAAVTEIRDRLSYLADADGSVTLRVKLDQLTEYLTDDPRPIPEPRIGRRSIPTERLATPPHRPAMHESEDVKTVLERMGFQVETVPLAHARAYPAPRVPRPSDLEPPSGDFPTEPANPNPPPPKAPPSPFMAVVRQVFSNAPDLLAKAQEADSAVTKAGALIEALASDSRVQRLAQTVIQHLHFPPPPPPPDDEDTPPTTRN